MSLLTKLEMDQADEEPEGERREGGWEGDCKLKCGINQETIY